MLSRNLLDCLCPAVLSFQQVFEIAMPLIIDETEKLLVFSTLKNVCTCAFISFFKIISYSVFSVCGGKNNKQN